MNYHIRLNNGQVLKGIIKSPGDRIRSVIIMVHGLGEHIQRYNNWSGYFLRENMAFTGIDLPGHGESGGKRGHIGSYKYLHEIIDVLIRESKKTFPGIPVVLYGHSLGGLIVLDYLLSGKCQVKGAIVTSPLLRLAFQPDKFRLMLASVVKHILPSLIQPTALVADHLSHDRKVVEDYINDPLVHGQVSVGFFHGMMKSASYTLKNADELKVPVLILHGSDDMICSPSGSREFASGTRLADFRLWEGGYHELHNEPFRDEVFKVILDWMNTRLKL